MATVETAQNQHVNDRKESPALEAEAILKSHIDLPSAESCVICLDHITEKAIALPCKHDRFDFPCLGTWIQQSQVCPLCKAEVKAVEYDLNGNEGGSKIFYIPARDIPRRRPTEEINRRRARAQAYHPYHRGSRRGQHQRGWGERPTISAGEDTVLERRREVYRRKMYSAYVGANRISRYQNITPHSFTTSVSLVNRAKMFIRRELQVFDFLSFPSTSSGHGGDRRASNAEFLLEYIIGVLKSIDLKGATGQAEELLKDFLGRDNARLFLHELEAWLRSPYERLSDWDRHVQYSDIVETGQSSNSREG